MESLKKTVRLALSLAFAALVSTACDESHRITGPAWSPVPSGGSGEVVERLVPISGVDAVRLSGIGTLYVRQGTGEELRVRAEERILDRLNIDVVGGELVIGFLNDSSFQNVQSIEFHLTVTHPLRRAVLSGVGRIQGFGLSTGALELAQSGLGSLNFDNLQAQSLVLSMSGLGGVTLSGTVQTQTVTLSGFGDYSAGGLQSDDATIRIEDRGSATVRVRDRLDAIISGSGSVYYYGSPVVHETITGSGRCEKLD